MPGRRILITGISGLELGKIMQVLSRDHSLRCYKAEKHLLEQIRATGLHFEFPRLPPDMAQMEMIAALRFPKDILQDCWEKAFEKLMKEVSSESDDTGHSSGSETDVILSAHMCFYHQQSREFAPIVNTTLLADKYAPDMIVTLVDDIEHIHQRLRRQGHMFSPRNYDYREFRGFAQACKNLTQLIHWRASEIAFAENFARTVEKRHYLVAVKHPVGTLRGLLFEDDRPRVYFSHPISEPRRQLARGETDAFSSFCSKLEAITADLRNRVTLFEPTTIDEFRFRNFKVTSVGAHEAKTTVYLPTLAERWPLPAGGHNLLLPPTADENPVDPHGHFAPAQLSEFEEAKKTWSDESSRRQPNAEKLQEVEARLKQLLEIDNATHLMGTLVGEIQKQVAARDLKLVEQSDHLVVVRPLFDGNASGGVDEEIQQHCRLVARGTRPRGHLWIFTAQEDEKLWRRIAAAEWLHVRCLGRHGISSKEIEKVLGEVKLDVDSPDQMPRVLQQLEELVLTKFKARLIEPQSTTLGPTHEAQSTVAWGALVGELGEQLTPPYAAWLAEYKNKLDVDVPHTIYWGDPWPRMEDLADLYRALGV